MNMDVAPPRGERGLKPDCKCQHSSGQAVAPPRGERGLKPFGAARSDKCSRRSPSWGAWIETRRGLRRHNTYAQSLPLVGSVD